MFKFEAPSDHILTALKQDITNRKNQGQDYLDTVTVMCNNGLVITHKSLMCTHSPVLREILGQQSTDTAQIILHDFSREAVEVVVGILGMEWEDTVFFDREVMELLKTLGINVGEIEAMPQKVKNYVTEVNIIDEIKDNESTVSIPDDKPEKIRPPSQVGLVNCPICSKLFLGNRDSLKRHIVLVHYADELNKLHKRYFCNSQKCKGCGQISIRKNSRRHVVIKHANDLMEMAETVVQEVEKNKCTVEEKEEEMVGAVVQEVAKNKCTVEEKEEDRIISTKSKEKVKEKWEVKNNEKKEPKVIKAYEDEKEEENTADQIVQEKPDLQFTLLPQIEFQTTCPKYPQDKNKNTEGRKIDIVDESNTKEEENAKDEIVAPKSLKCMYCKIIWKPEDWKTNLKQLIKDHMISSHFHEQISANQPEYFEGDTCNVCDRTIKSRSERLRHLFGKHDIMRDEVENCVNAVFNDDKDVGKMHMHNEQNSNGEIFEDVEKLLESDDEDQNLKEDAQVTRDASIIDIEKNSAEKLLQSDDEEGNSKKDDQINENQLEDISDIDIQTRLLLDQDLSDDEEEEEDEIVADNKEGKESTINKTKGSSVMLDNVTLGVSVEDRLNDEEETSAIQQMLLGDVSDDEISDEENSEETYDKKVNRAHDEAIDKEEAEVDRDVQKQLLLDQDWSDDDDDDIFSPENEITKEIESLKDISDFEHIDVDKRLTELINRIDADLLSC